MNIERIICVKSQISKPVNLFTVYALFSRIKLTQVMDTSVCLSIRLHVAAMNVVMNVNFMLWAYNKYC